MSHHHNHHQKNNNNASQANADTVEVYAPDTKTLYTVPRGAISHSGNNASNASDGKGRLLVCRSYCNAIEAGERPSEITACAMGNQCRFVHIDVPLSKVKGDIIHVHYVYRNESLCQYESLSTAILREQPAAEKDKVENVALMIYGPNNREPVERIPASRLLLTGGSRYAYECATNPRRNANGTFADQPRVCHCAHFYFTQTCNRGANCSFIHVISVDANQKVDTSKPANYRRRVAQLGQPEVPQMAMSPQTQFHSNAPSAQSTPMTIGHRDGGSPHLGRQVAGSNNSSPTLNNPNKPNGTPMTSPYTNASNRGNSNTNSSSNGPMHSPLNGAVPSRALPPKPLTGSPQPQMQMDVVVGVKGSSPNFANASYANESTNNTTGYTPQQSGAGTWAQQGPYHSSPNTHSNRPHHEDYQPQQYGNVPGTPSRIRAMYMAPPPPPTASPSIGTSMLPMDDVVESTGGADAYHQSSPNTAYNYQSAPNFSINNNADNFYQQQQQQQYGHGPAPTSPMQQQYANSNRASPMGTPSTAMHKGGNRYAHNPYAQSPVTMQAQM